MQNKRQISPKTHQPLAAVLLPEYRRVLAPLLQPDQAPDTAGSNIDVMIIGEMGCPAC